MMFTAIALVAFSSASLANTIADEEVVIKKNEVSQNVNYLIIQQANPCKNNFSVALNQAYQMGYNDSQAWNYASVAYIFCSNGLVAPIY